jgi:Raf kinase inhibitor-like YbhB/YbcL family protein
MQSLELRSSAFNDHGFIPERHSYHGGNLSPPIEWIGIPADSVELVLLCEDPDAPRGTFLHWLVTGIHPHTPGFPEDVAEEQVVEWPNGFGEVGWGGPAPPPGDRAHRYLFLLLALTQPVELPDSPSTDDVHQAVEGITMGRGALVGLYQR